jgi:outer membrane protein assembly factor BamB
MVNRILLFLLVAASVRADDWPAWRGPNRTGISTETGWNASNPKQLWKTNVGTGCATVSIANGRLYTAGNQKDTDTIWCLDAATGKEIWKHEYPEPLAPKLYEGGVNATPTVDGNVVFTVSRSGKVFCLGADNGKLIWSKNLATDFGIKTPGWGHAGSPLVHDNILLLDSVALNKSTGALLWKADEPPSYSSPLIAFNNLVLLFNADGLSLREVATGKLVAHHPWKTSYDVNAATPIVDGDKIFISSGYNHGATLLQCAGNKLTPLWENKKMRNQMSTCILWQGHLYGINEDVFTCMEFATGEVKWTGGTGIKKGSLMMADGKLIILGDKGDLVIVEATPAAYKEMARAKVLDGHCWSMPVLANGRIYCKTIPGDLVCLDVTVR